MKYCPNVLSRGTCEDTTCQYEHHVLVCEPCSFIATSEKALTSHLKGRRHSTRISGGSVTYFCPVCETNVTGSVWDQHIKGTKHRKKAKHDNVAPDVEPLQGIDLKGQKYCNICKQAVTGRMWEKHLLNNRHKTREKYTSYRAALDEAEKDKNGIIVEGHFDFGIMEPAHAAGGASLTVVLKTTTPNLRVELISLNCVSSRAGMNPTFSVTPEGTNKDISPRSSIKLAITLKQMHIGRYEDRLEMIFEDIQLKKRFLISRPISVIVGNAEDHEKLKATAPYIPRRRTERKPEKRIIEGVRPPALTAIPYVGTLPKAAIRPALLALLSRGSVEETVARLKTAYLPSVLDSETFARHFRTLIWIEEQRADEDLQRYDILDAKLQKHNSYYYVEVPGLAEKRPSVLIGDRILAQQQGAPEGDWFEGFAHVVHQREVGLRFHSKFRGWSENQRYHIRFKLNRVPYRRQHHALDMVFQEDRVLFPTANHALSVPLVHPTSALARSFHNPDIASNPQQVQAVVSITKLPPGSPTFIIFGPFGTGKTSTMIEAVLQVLATNPQSRVLVCAPSNSAADLIVTKLRHVLNNEKLFRFMAPSRFKSQVPDDVLPFTHLKDDIHFGVPMVRIKHFRVIVSTCVSASFAAGIGLPRGHFSHIFVDEAGQATEPEALVGIKTLANPNTNIILAGDPKQLGPIIRSPVARELGLQKSYLERLMDRDAYDIDKYSGLSVIKLLHNYRSHPAILKFPNEQFYRGELQVRASATKINKYLSCPLLPSPMFPIVFHAVFGKDDREASSPSFFNIDEALQIKQYVQRLRADTNYRTTEDDIGIITPYHAQCLKVRTALRGVCDGIKVGSVEEFQGQERPVIMISTVRSSKEFIEYDLRHTLGFVANPRRFNVAVTRAQALLIIVGDPQVLSLDPMWRSFLNYVYNSGGWTGPRPDWDTNAEVNVDGGYDKAIRERAEVNMNEFTRRMEVLTGEGMDLDDAGVEQPWRDIE
ncbi:hypothetical protein AX15_003007 [Amanita polypyramis BW_CC]|nr:hypothetical protein AX15_003007 [Amanita polypyramis BW_CC]